LSFRFMTLQNKSGQNPQRAARQLTYASYHRIVRRHHEIRGAVFVRGHFLVG
jgi:hypothetical protein